MSALSPTSRPLLVIAGPTATGKTHLAVEIARQVPSEIISGDAFGVYRHMPIGTAQPTVAERHGIPFHLVGTLEPDEPFTVALFQRMARAALSSIWGRGRLPVVCGGTGFYLRALLHHFRLPPPDSTGELRARLYDELDRLGPQAMHERLRQVDPSTAQRLPVTDARRVLRALEVYEVSGTAASELASVDPDPEVSYNSHCYVLTCPRTILYERINKRVHCMLRAGWIDEVRALCQSHYGPDLPAWQALGYQELREVLHDRLPLEAAVARIQVQTRQFAKRQLTWFRREPGFTWLTWAQDREWEIFRHHLVSVARRLLQTVPS